ncbi:MAG: hypothetical protein WBQ23_13355 [Bacteroidota bacterium]
MSEHKASRKYQVYFFLYLAVVCELLIIIVERDDAEREVRLQQMRERDMLRLVIQEMMQTLPVLNTEGSNQMKVGETRTFELQLQGVSSGDRVTRTPEVVIKRGGVMIDSMKLGDGIREVPSQTDGERRFAFDWRAPASGSYTFSSTTGTDRISVGSDNINVKLGSLSIPFDVIAAIVPDFKKRIDGAEKLDAELTVEVIPEGDQMIINGGSVITAAGFPATALLEVQGTAVTKVSASTTSGNVSRENGRLRWSGTFADAGKHEVTIFAADARGAGQLSRSQHTFTVTAKWPVSESQRSQAFAGEYFQKDLMVAGLETRTSYSWRAELAGSEIASGVGAMAEFQLPEGAAGKELRVDARYEGNVYPVAKNEKDLGDSRFIFPVLKAPARFRNISFSRGGEYPVNQEFRFDVNVSGDNRIVNSRPPQRITVEAESEQGRDLLEDVLTEPIHDSSGRNIGTRVRFYLKGRVAKDGDEVQITLRADEAKEDITVVIFPE